MKLTKLEHAALILEVGGQKLYIDPGSFTTALTETAGAAAVVITHEHPDHWTPDQLRRILEVNEGVPIYAPAGVAAAVATASARDDAPRGPPPHITVVRDGDTVTAGPFTLRFFGQTHAVIHESIPVVDNVGVLVNEELYYAGDSFTIPTDVQVGTLAVPAGAPWLKISEVIDYVLAVRPRRSFPTHEMVLSRAGKDLSNARIKAATQQGDGEFFPLEPGDVLDL
ncbi:MBL fold metallo-hydrolase [Cryobacterium psychrophilum]|uniref:MBL fold metallo-hydrolase n=1 Tax=Cryobacterium psychrophilum TaxID=41988 RepID=A0A4Y8KNF9_9MICO|nr:MBL fold metallo-hydrolase [Cryobacterium psychrophilum]TDW31179.1 L-ascorbate metabolism protein UlaG (beta-lactamase superfamily) [Cryobacterium psychrophilum]TFD78528.1 MBL fold metallo-hydrolase [Cryobacterium psychrophilum]